MLGVESIRLQRRRQITFEMEVTKTIEFDGMSYKRSYKLRLTGSALPFRFGE
jgi:hypothetical protein